MPFMVGQTVGDYVVVGEAGHDEVSAFYTVEHTITRRREAMWILGIEGHCGVEDAARFFSEISHQASLSHPNIAGVHNAFWAGDTLVMICEWVDGEPLRAALDRGPLPLQQSLEIMSAVLSALRYAHANSVRYCAISPERILLTRDGSVKLLNVGFTVTEESDRCKPDDLYACGVTFHELVTGSKPVSSRIFPDFLQTRCEEAVLRAIGVNRKLTAELTETIGRGIASEPEARFQSSANFHHAVLRLRESSRTVAAKRPPLSHPRILTGIAAGGLACALLLMASNVTMSSPEPPVTPRPVPPVVAQAAPPAPTSVPAPTVNLKSRKKPSTSSTETSNQSIASTVTPQQTRKNPIVRFAGAFKRLNPIGRRDNRQTVQTQTDTNLASPTAAAKPAPTQISQKQLVSRSDR